MDDNITIFIFSWNHQAVRIGVSSLPSTATTSPEMWSLSNIYESHPPDFFPDVEKKIVDADPDIVVFGSQEDPIPGSYFHSDFLPQKMAELYYNLQKRTRLMGLGIETYKAIKTLDFKLRGLRLSIYAKPHLTGLIALEERNMRDFLGEKGQLWANCSFPFLQSKGAVASYLKMPGMEPIAFICAHLPFDAESLKQAFSRKDLRIREKAVSYSNLSFNYLLQELVLNVPLEDRDGKPMDVGHVFFFGDLNYRVFSVEVGMEERFLSASLEEDLNAPLRKILQENDELYQELQKGRIHLDFQEGVHNEGPLFLPTCKMKKPRVPVEDASTIHDLFNIGKGQRKPSWCDRILYWDRVDNPYGTTCHTYDRMDVGETMAKSDHAAVYALFSLQPK